MKQPRRNVKLALPIASVMLALTACGGIGSTGSDSASVGANGTATGGEVGEENPELDGTLTLGAVLPLTGSSATIGMDQQRGIELAVKDINANGGVLGKSLKVQIEDSEDRAESAIQAAQKLVNVNDAPLVIGEYSSGNTIPMQQFLEKKGVVGINSGSSSSEVSATGDLQFSTIGLDHVASEFAAQSLWDAGHKSISIIAPNNAYGSGVSESVEAAYEELGGKTKETILYTEGESDYRQVIERLKSSTPDAYVVTMYGQDGTVINRQMYELGLNDNPTFHIYLSMDVPDSDPAAVEGDWGMDVGIEGNGGDAYAQAYQDEYGEDFATAFNGFAYDATMMAAQAINEAEVTEPEAIADALFTVSEDYVGVTGPIEFDENGQRVSQEYLLADVSDGEIVPRN